MIDILLLIFYIKVVKRFDRSSYVLWSLRVVATGAGYVRFHQTEQEVEVFGDTLVNAESSSLVF